MIGRLFAVALALVVAGCAHPSAPAGKRPNLVLIVADDLGYGHVSTYGGRMPTPHIDALGRDGVVFTNGHTTATNCAPSRAGLLTGRSQNEFGFEFNPGLQEGETAGRGVPLDTPMLQEILRRNGYATALIGKWHEGQSPQQVPNARGFDEFFGFHEALAGFITHPEPGDAWVEGATWLHSDGDRPNAKIRRNGEPVRVTNYLTDAFTDEAVSFINRRAEAPFMLYVAYNAPHSPLEATKKYLDRVTWTTDRRERIYDAMMLAVDDGVGAIVAALKAKGVYDNTIVVFISDNGCPIRPQVRAYCSNAPFGGSKITLWEGGHRVPFILKDVDGRSAGLRSDALVSAMDLAPTVAAAAGVRDAPRFSGINLGPLLAGNADPPRDWLAWRTGPNAAIVKDGWKLYLAAKAGPDEQDMTTAGDEGGAPDPARLASMNANEAERVRRAPLYGVGAPEFGWHVMLHDLAADPSESRNLAAERPEKVRELRAVLDGWAKSLPREPMWGPQTIRVYTTPDNVRVRMPG